MTAARFEVLPTGTIEDKILEHVPVERMLTVTASPAKGLEATLDLTERLLKQGYNVMPHLAARMVRDKEQLAEIADRLVEAGVQTVFVPAGDKTPPEGCTTHRCLPARLDRPGPAVPGIGITGYIVGSLKAPPLSWDADAETLRDEIESQRDGLPRSSVQADPLSSREHVLLST